MKPKRDMYVCVITGYDGENAAMSSRAHKKE